MTRKLEVESRRKRKGEDRRGGNKVKSREERKQGEANDKTK